MSEKRPPVKISIPESPGEDRPDRTQERIGSPMQSDNFYRTIFDTAPIGIGLATLDGRILMCNDFMSRLTGYSEAQLHQTPLPTLYRHPADRETLLLRIQEEGMVHEFETELKHRAGSFFHARLSAIPVNLEGSSAILKAVEDITKCKLLENELKQINVRLEARSRTLEEANIIMHYLLKHREDDIFNIEATILGNVQELIMPYIKQLKVFNVPAPQADCVSILENNLKNIVSPFLHTMTLKHSSLTPREIQVASLIKEGKCTKEIASLTHLSTRTIDFHRNNIREKLGLRNTKTNLATYLASLA